MTGEHIRSFAREQKPYVLEFEIKGLPKILSNGSHSSWRAVHAHKKQWKELVWLAVGRNAPKAPLECARLTLTRYSSQPPDSDGLVISFKAVIDGLKQCGVIKDDKVTNIGMPKYVWEKAKIREGKITVRVESV